MSDPGTDLVPDAPDEARALARVSEDWARMLLTQAKVKVLVASGVFPDLKSVAIGMTKAWAGEPFGLDPFAAQTAFDIINGKVEANANLHAAMVKRHPNYDYKVTYHDNERCEITFYGNKRTGKWQELAVSVFTMSDAMQAGLLKNQVWKSYPRSMLFARAITNGVAWYCPDVMSFRTYSEGEIGGNERPPELPEGMAETSVEEVIGLNDSTDEPEPEGAVSEAGPTPSGDGPTTDEPESEAPALPGVGDTPGSGSQSPPDTEAASVQSNAVEDRMAYTPAMMKKVRALAKELGWDNDTLHAKARVDSLTALDMETMGDLITLMEAEFHFQREGA